FCAANAASTSCFLRSGTLKESSVRPRTAATSIELVRRDLDPPVRLLEIQWVFPGVWPRSGSRRRLGLDATGAARGGHARGERDPLVLTVVPRPGAAAWILRSRIAGLPWSACCGRRA